MKGYRTIVANAVAFVASLLAVHGIEVDAEAQAQIIAGVFALMNIGLRFITTTPIGDSE